MGLTVRLMFDVRPLLLFGGLGTVLGLMSLLLHYMAISGESAYFVFMYLFSFGLVMFGFGFVLAAYRSLRKHKWHSSQHE